MDQDLLQNYAEAGFSNELGMGTKPAVVVVDLVRGYLESGSPLFSPRYRETEAGCLRLVTAARATCVPVIFTNVVYSIDGRDGGYFVKKVPALSIFSEGSKFGDFGDLVTPESGELVVSKQYASGFFGTSLASTLHVMGVDTVVVAGVSTSGCVRATALDALQSGFRSVVVREAVGDRDARPHEANLFDLAAKYSDVVSIDTAVEYFYGLGTGKGE